jgi:23S rRNA maturation mini-RNase III
MDTDGWRHYVRPQDHGCKACGEGRDPGQTRSTRILSVLFLETRGFALRALDRVLDDDERDVVRRARNIRAPGARHVAQEAYRHATAFEALIGYLYLVGPPERLRDLLAIADQAMEGER